MAFVEENSGGLIYMRSTLIPARHAFTTRCGGVSKGAFSSLNLGSNRGDESEAVRENYRRVCALMGADIDGCAVTKQVHGNTVRLVTAADKHRCMGAVPYEADGLVTSEKHLPIMCFVADCVPVLLFDAESATAAAVHCGWRPTVADILGEAVKKMRSLGARAENIRAAIGPSIGFCCFETGADVPRAVEELLRGDTAGLIVSKADGKFLVDLRGVNARRLMQLGLPRENIDISDECTMCSHDKYWSHRYTKGQRGSQSAVIVLE